MRKLFTKIKKKYEDYRVRSFTWKQIKQQVRTGFKSGRFICTIGSLSEIDSNGDPKSWRVKSSYYNMESEINRHLLQFAANGFQKEVETRRRVILDRKGKQTTFIVPLEVEKE